MDEVFEKVITKAKYLTKLNIPPSFKKKDPTRVDEGNLNYIKAPSSFGEVPVEK